MIIIFSGSVLLTLTSDLVVIVVFPTGNMTKGTDHLRIQNLDICDFVSVFVRGINGDYDLHYDFYFLNYLRKFLVNSFIALYIYIYM